jgi:hypothetical protein
LDGEIMPRKNKRNADDFDSKAIHSLSEGLVKPVYRIPKALLSRNSVKEYRYKRNVAIDVFGLALFVAILIMLGNMNFLGFGKSFIILAYIGYGIIGIVVISGTIWLVRKYKSKQFTSAEVSIPIHKALEIMDSTGKWYNDENAANQELVSTLKALKFDAVYPYRLSNGRTADAKIGNTLIEGKLSPDTAEVDRLIGQLSDYTRYANKLNVVIYGKLENEARRRLENEISLRYTNRVFLTYLNNPRRLRSEQFDSSNT